MLARPVRAIALMLGAVLVGSLLHAPALAAPERGAPPLPEAAEPARGKTGTVKPRGPNPTADAALTAPPAVTWPAAGVTDVAVSAPRAGRAAPSTVRPTARAGGLPVAVASGARGRVRVQTFEREVSERAGVSGPMLQVRRSGAGGGTGPVSLTVGYSGFEAAYGGDYGARLRLVSLPGCAATTPARAECRTVTPLPSTNDTATRTVSAQVDPSAGSVLALAAEDASSQGSYAATSLSPSSSWDVALSSGGFSWSYPLRAPAVPGGLAPEVTLAYSSQAVDGRTAATNNQGSWIGEGFTYEPGYLERRFKPCPDDGHDQVGDQCWARQNATIMLGGRSGELVKINDTTWKLADDDGSKIELLANAQNGDNDGEHWKLTTPDGTQYFFGLNRLPGWTGATGQEETRSTWTVPVYGDDADEPCNRSSGFADSFCDQAWRWNLDYVKDVRGNVISYFYEREINHYARGFRLDVNGDDYHRGGHLRRIDYGQRDGQVYSTAAPARMQFATAERCLPSGAVDCDPGDLTAGTAASWPDVPFDLNCAPNTHCKAEHASPSFWTRKRLTKITTEIRAGTGWSPVESWALTHTFENNGDASRTLWLSKIVHAGHWGGEAVTLPSIDLVGMQMPNRIDVEGDHISPLIRFRLKTIYTETGGQTDINYAPVDCAAGSLPRAGESTRRCYPVRWNPLGTEDPITDWFHKYVVAEVIQTDRATRNPDMVTRYEYSGDAGWRKAEPDGITKSEDLTWGDWRGYGKVTVRTGDVQQMYTRVDHVYLRGLHGDPLPDGGTRTSTVSDSTGVSYQDKNEWVGHELETIAYDGAAVVSKSISAPWLHHTATQTETWGTRRASLVRTETVRTLTALAPDAQGRPQWRETKASTTHDTTWGRVLQVDDLGDVSQDADDRCTRTTYVDNPAKYLYANVSRSEMVSVKCAVTAPNRATQLINDTKTSYDGLAHGAAPTAGSVTKTEEIRTHNGTTAVYVTTSESTVDGFGRTLTEKDALGNVTTTAYTETNGLTTQTKVTNPLQHSVTTTIDPAFGGPTKVVDVNDKVTHTEYDALGRLAKVWLPDRSRDAGQTPNVKHTYLVRADKPAVAKTEKVKNDGTYSVSYQILDGLLRPRQTQTEGPRGGWLLTDTYHTSTGKVAKTNAAYLALGTPGDMPIIVPEGSVNGQTSYVYDGADRVVADVFSVAGDERWRTTTRYVGDRMHVDPPSGGTPTTTVTDARGNTIELHNHHGTAPTGSADVMRYTHTPAGDLASVTDAAGNVWRYAYNLRRQKITSEDPDAGTTVFTYDDLGRVTSSRDGEGRVVANVYDKIGRKVETWQGAATTGTKLAEWSYDGLARGQLHWSARYVNGKAYGVVHANLDALYRPLKTSYVIPSDAGAELAKTYDFTTVYNTDGTVQSVGMPGAGGLTGEAVVTSYDNLGRATALTGSTPYATALSYADTGELLQMELSTGAKKAWLTFGYERGTGRLASSRLERQGVATVDMDARYRYDEAGNVLSIADTPAGGSRDIQCFNHDHLRRLTEAWATANTNADPCVGGPATTGVGGPAPYHLSWSFDDSGNRGTETEHSTTGGADTTRTYVYPPAGGARPHALSRVEESGPAGARTSTYAYDGAGNTISRQLPGQAAQTLAWDTEGHLASVTANNQTTAFVYDGNGARLLRKEPNATTVYLPGMELRLDHASRQVSATRFYTFGGRTVAVRSTAGVQFQAADHHGTATCSIDAVTGAISWRRGKPYGGPRGPQPSSWPDQKGFVGGTQDPTTGLTHLGAREYDTATGRFVSVDPLLDTTKPQQMQGYSYGYHSPVTNSDQSGLDPCLGGGGGCYHDGTDPPGKSAVPPKPKQPSCTSKAACEKKLEDKTSSWGKPPRIVVHTLDPSKFVLMRPQEFGCDQKASCHEMMAWTDTIVEYAMAAGIDPQLLMSVLMIEVGRSDELYPIDNAIQFGSWALDSVGAYGWLKDKVTGKGASPPSLGWGNIQEAAFDETVAGHQAELGGVEWTDLMGNHELSIEVTAYRLRDLQDIAEQTATVQMRQDYTPQEVAAAMYNVGTQNYSEAVRNGNLGPLGRSYALAVRRNYGPAYGAICVTPIRGCVG